VLLFVCYDSTSSETYKNKKVVLLMVMKEFKSKMLVHFYEIKNVPLQQCFPMTFVPSQNIEFFRLPVCIC